LNLTISQLAALAAGAGFSGNDLAIAIAVALAESQGNPQAYNPEKAAGAVQGQGSFGLWQIFLSKHPEFSAVDLLDPQTNAAAAFTIYSNAGNSFRPWATYTNQAYLPYMGAVVDFLNASSTTSAPDVSPADLSTMDQSAQMGAPDTGQLILMMAGGALALWLLMRAFNG